MAARNISVAAGIVKCNVPHLWATSKVWKDLGKLSDDMDVPLGDSADLNAFISLAEHFRKLGEDWGHDQGPPFLNGNRMWVVSVSPALSPEAHTFEKVALSEKALRALTDRNRGN